MALTGLQVSNKQKAQDSPRLETNTRTLGADEPTDPRPLPKTHDRYLDVEKVLERSLPRVSGED